MVPEDESPESLVFGITITGVNKSFFDFVCWSVAASFLIQ